MSFLLEDFGTVFTITRKVRHACIPNSITSNMSSEPETGLLTSLNTMRGLSDVMEGELDNLVRVMPTPSPRAFQKFCELFLLDADQRSKFQNLEEELQIPFTKLRLPSYQAWDAYFMLISNMRGLNGGILAYQHASNPTTYKQICLAVCFIRALLVYSKADCKRDWALSRQDQSHQRRHLPQDNPFSQQCPSGDPLGLQCYCSGGATRDIADFLSRGAQLIFVRKESVDEWVKLLERCSPDPKYYEPLLIHHFYRENLRPPPEFKGKMEIEPSFMRTSRRGEQSVFDAEWTVRPPSTSNPQRQPERYIVLVGQEVMYLKRYRTFMSNRLDDFGYDQRDPKLKGQAPIDPSGRDLYSYGAFVGLHIIDQFDRLSPTSPIFELIAEHRHIMDKNVDTWAVSEKPMSNDFFGLIHFFRCISRNSWNDQLHRHHYKLPGTLRESDMVFQRAINPRLAANSKDLQIARDHFANKMFLHLVCRRTLNSKWFDRCISKYMEPTTISLNTPRGGALILDVQGIFDKARADIRAICGGSFNVNQVVRCLKTFKQLTNCQVVSTFPAAAGYLLEGDFDMSHEAVEARLVKAIGTLGRRSSLEFFPFPEGKVDELVANSGKLTTILHGIEMMMGMAGERQRMVITSLHLFEAALVLAGVRRHFEASALKIVYLPSHPTDSERQYFSSYWSSEDRNSIRVVIVLADFQDSDLGLDRANWQILTGPVRTKEHEARIFSLTNSARQYRRLHHFLLCTENNPADRLILSMQANCTVTSDPFDMNSPLLLQELAAEAGPRPNIKHRTL